MAHKIFKQSPGELGDIDAAERQQTAVEIVLPILAMVAERIPAAATGDDLRNVIEDVIREVSEA